jgi:hypothetical protein
MVPTESKWNLQMGKLGEFNEGIIFKVVGNSRETNQGQESTMG